MRRKPNPLLGILGGLMLAFGLSLFATVIYVLRPGTFERLGISLGTTLSLYLVGGLIGGAICGFLLPLTTYRWGATVVGAVTALPVYLGAAMLMDAGVSTGVLLAALVGGVVGFQVWERPRDGDQRNTQKAQRSPRE